MPARHLCLSLLLVAYLAVTCNPARAATPGSAGLTSCNAAGCVPPGWGAGQIAAGFGPTPFRPGQTFTPKFTGALSAVHLGLETVTSPTVNAIAEIRTTAGGLPTTTILAEVVVPGAPYTPGVLYSADFTAQNLVLTAGTRYAVTLRCAAHQYILAAFPACPTTTGTNDYVFSDNEGQTWAQLVTRERSIIFEVCLDAATPTRASTWGRVKAIYR